MVKRNMIRCWEVVIEGAEPWPPGIGIALTRAVDAAERQGTLLGFGLDVHDDAEGPCFGASAEAEAVASAIREDIWSDYQVFVLEHEPVEEEEAAGDRRPI